MNDSTEQDSIESKSGRDNGRAFLWRRACFPIVISCCAFICFVIVYWLCTARAINPFYIAGAFFIIPCLVFALIAYLAGKNKIDRLGTIFALIILVPVLFFGSLFYFFNLSLIASSSTTTNVSRYERTMKLGGYSKKEHLAIFPEKIPKDASNVFFYYSESSWMEYSQTVALRFSVGRETINGYVEQCQELAVKSNANDINNKSGWNIVKDKGIQDLPSGYIVYVIINQGEKVCTVSINIEKNNIIFYADEFRW